MTTQHADAGETQFAGLDELDLDDLLYGLQKGFMTSEDLVKTYLARIAEVNDKVRAVGCLNPDAVALAVERDEQRRGGKILGQLHGIPVLVKDTFATVDKMDTTAGSYALVGAKYHRAATIIKRLEAAGAIILGKANMTEWGMARTAACRHGWSAVHGQALGGFVEDQDPHGSSSGNAIAASMNLAAANIGGETCGSIIIPASRNAVVGLKPTVGLTSRAGLVPINSEWDTAGPMTRWVKDSARILQVIAGKDELDPATQDIPFDTIPDYVASCSVDGCQGMRIAVLRTGWWSLTEDAEYRSAFEDAVKVLGQLGAVIVDDVRFDRWAPDAEISAIFCQVLLKEAFEDFFGNLKVNPHNIRTISDLVEFTKRTPEEQYERLGAEGFEKARDVVGSSKCEVFLECKSKLEDLGDDLARLLDYTSCDVLLAPPMAQLPLSLGRLPAISVPMGYYRSSVFEMQGWRGGRERAANTPFGILFTGRRFSEEKLIACAYAFEQATMEVNVAPGKLLVKPSTDITELLNHEALLADNSDRESEITP
ncbi:putative amidase [Cercophora newfieldiana]|uniref:Amidase n=1 Tax=Cercophora newfieldiana TaxID=92897 RepID=A0AA39YEL9_9PEZI|nr:putative amidase [Cercophora newfieldiana]